MYMYGWYVHVHAGAHRIQKEVLDPLKLEL